MARRLGRSPSTASRELSRNGGCDGYRATLADERGLGERLAYHFTNEENGLVLRRYWTNACQGCAIKHSCTTGKERRISRWEHERVLEAVQRRLDEHPEKMRQRRETVEHPFGFDQGPDGSNPLSDEDAATRRHRDGAARAGLQPHARHEYHRRPATLGSDEGIVVDDMRPSILREAPSMAGGTADAGRQCFGRSVFTQPRR